MSQEHIKVTLLPGPESKVFKSSYMNHDCGVLGILPLPLDIMLIYADLGYKEKEEKGKLHF